MSWKLEQMVNKLEKQEGIEQVIVEIFLVIIYLCPNDVFFANTPVGAQKLISILGNFYMLNKLYLKLRLCL